MTDLTKAKRFLADQREKNGKRKKEKEPTFSVTTCQSKHQGSCSGEDFSPKTPRLLLFFFFLLLLFLTFPFVKKKSGVRVFGARYVLLLFRSKEVKLLIVEFAWRR